jgi:hypothetical protein
MPHPKTEAEALVERLSSPEARALMEWIDTPEAKTILACLTPQQGAAPPDAQAFLDCMNSPAAKSLLERNADQRQPPVLPARRAANSR